MEKCLICITSCNRLHEIKKYIFPFIQYCNSERDFHFVLALDGHSKDYLDFCDDFKIPLIYSDEREGVGLSKNRVLSQFPDFDHYFFIDDDVELVDEKIFRIHCELGRSSEQFYHLSSTRLFHVIETEKINDLTLIYGNEGGGYFNYFNAKGLKRVGGWHTKFAEFKRYGHTEHSYRFFHQGMTRHPFTIIRNCIEMVIIHSPEHVTKPIGDFTIDLFPEEKKLIDQRLQFFPLETISKYYYNGYDTDFIQPVKLFLEEHPQKYPLISGKTRIICLSNYYLNASRIHKNSFTKFLYLCLSMMLCPSNPEIKHLIKAKLKLV